MLVSLMISVMYLRTPLHYEYMHDFHGKLASMVEQHGVPSYFIVGGKQVEVDPESWPSYRDASEDDLKRLWIIQMSNATEYAEIIMGMRWSIIVADEPTFITSDNPVVITHPSLEFRGLSNPETLILFPLCPQRVLTMDYHHEQPANQYYPLQGNGAAQNLLIWRNAIDYMFSHQNSDDVCRKVVAETDAMDVVD